MKIIGRIPYKTAFIVNRHSGKGRAHRAWRQVQKIMAVERCSYQVFFTRFPGDGSIQAERARAAGAELLVAVGGDGTIREVVNGMDPGKNLLGIIPAGTGNGFRRALGLPGSPLETLRGLGKWPVRPVDLGLFNGSYFVNVVGIGFDAAVAEKYYQSRLKGYSAYVQGYFASINRFHSFPVEIMFDEGPPLRGSYFLVAVANGTHYGGRACFAPQALQDDGCLDLCLVQKRGNLDFMSLTIKVLFKKHLGHPAYQTVRCTEVKIVTGFPVPVQVDGELADNSGQIQIGVQPRALPILCPPAPAAAVDLAGPGRAKAGRGIFSLSPR